MWDLNPNLEIETLLINDSPAYVVDSFYKEPHKVARYLFNRDTPLYKEHEGGTANRNGIDFEDKVFREEKITPAHDFIETLCGQKPYKGCSISTNQHRFKCNNYNRKYETHYWWAHLDSGYNGIVYFNHDQVNGTNLYNNRIKVEHLPKVEEGVDPWIPKEHLELVHHFEPKFNRLVLFDGSKFPHGMAINNDRYHCKRFVRAPWNTYRSNQVFFYE